jgi:small subunit ribosomal protein S20
MANIASARKRARQDVKQNAHNSSLRSRLRTAIKAVPFAWDTVCESLRT